MVTASDQAQRIAELEARVRKAEGRFRALFEKSSDTITLLTLEGIILEANPRWKDVLHMEPEQLIGRHIRDFAPPGQEEVTDSRWADVRTRGGGRDAPMLLRRRDGASIYMEFSSTFIELDGEKLVLGIGHDVTERVLAARELETAERRYRSIVEQMPDAVWSADQFGQVTYVSPNIERITGLTAEEYLSDSMSARVDCVHPKDRERLLRAFGELLGDGVAFDVEYRRQRRDGSWVWLRNRASAVFDQDGVRRIEGLLSNITDRQRLDEQLRHALKMEAVGRLAGGIAHDFNNMLNILLGYTLMLLDEVSVSDPMYQPLVEMKRAGERSAALTRQLLTFSRQQPHSVSLVDLNATVQEAGDLARRLVGDDVEVESHLSGQRCTVEVDASQLDQIFMNIIVNAREAMPDGGKLTFETSVVTCDEKKAASLGLTSGRYVLVAIRDTGEGMDSQTQLRVFEPFFTTKEVGEGTGLGLSIVFGIVKQYGGHIGVHSEPGKGSTFNVYLPLADAPLEEAGSTATPATGQARSAGGGTVLLVEDEDQVRGFIEKVLRDDGYRVLTASNPTEAMALFDVHADKIDLLLTDVIMPIINGKELAEKLKAKRPTLKVLYMSGYTDRVDLAQDGPAGRSFLQKPVAPSVLRRKVRDAIGRTNIEVRRNAGA